MPHPTPARPRGRRSTRPSHAPGRHGFVLVLLLCAAAPWPAQAQDGGPARPVPAADSTLPGPTSPLARAFEAAWAWQPEAAALPAWREAAQAAQQAARRWTPEPPALALAGSSDRLNRNQGYREMEVGLSVPIWLPGERQRSGDLADAQAAATHSRVQAARLRLADSLRSTYWQWQLARIDNTAAQAQLAHARQLAEDVGRRLKAGELAPADQHQADAALAAAEAALAQAEGARQIAELAWRSLLGPAAGGLPAPSAAPLQDSTQLALVAEPEPTAPEVQALPPHPELQTLLDRRGVAEQAAALAAVQTRANPELSLSTTQERGQAGARWDRRLTLALRLPFGSGSEHGARRATAEAELAEVTAQLQQERLRLQHGQASAALQVASAKAQLVAAEHRAQLAAASRGFFQKSFQLGESDLPTRLRIEREADEAQRDAARGRVALAMAVSQWRQSLGLLPQ